MRGISVLAEGLFAFQEQLRCM